MPQGLLSESFRSVKPETFRRLRSDGSKFEAIEAEAGQPSSFG